MKIKSFNRKKSFATPGHFPSGNKQNTKTDNLTIEQRLQNIKDFYIKAGDLIDKLPDTINQDVKTFLKNRILGDKELRQLMEGIDNHRPPKIFVMGRTGTGKSSLINALCGAYVAPVGDIRSCTLDAEPYECKDSGRPLMEVLDTRGIGELTALDPISAEKKIIQQIKEFSPDVALLVLDAGDRSDMIKTDAEFMKKVSKEYYSINKVELPIVVVLNKCDQIYPIEYNDNKIKNINEAVQRDKEAIATIRLKVAHIIAVSSYLEWKTPDGNFISVEDINSLPKCDIENLQIARDGRYQIEELLDILGDSILDSGAKMGLRMASRLNDVVKRLAKQLNKIFSGLSMAVATTPIPGSDIYVLIAIQSILVYLIVLLSGREASLDTAKEFVFSMGGVAGAGYIFRLTSQQLTKFANIVFPGAGSTVSALIASGGTGAIGNAAIAYYIDGKLIDEVSKEFKKSRSECTVGEPDET